MNRALTPPFGEVATSNCFNEATVVKTINISDQERMSLKPVSIKLNTKKRKAKGKRRARKKQKKDRSVRKKNVGEKKEKLLLKNIRLLSRENITLPSCCKTHFLPFQC